MVSTLKRLLVGKPLATAVEAEQRLTKLIALPIFAADAIASSAFATEEILRVLVPVGGMAALDDLIPISLVVVALLVVVVTSYLQTITSYPGGGGSYVVSRENLGVLASLTAGASLMVDYTLTVAVSIAAGTAAIVSAAPSLNDHTLAVCLVLVGLLTLANLRGLKESGWVFAVPTYLYVLGMSALIIVGLVRLSTGDIAPLPANTADLNTVTGNGVMLGVITPFLLARAFSSGAVALSGVEVISNGVQAFKEPAPRNAKITLALTGALLAGLFSGVAVLTDRLRPTLSDDQTILSTMGRHVFGTDSPLYFIVQASIAIILIYSANTAFAGFPRLSAIIAKDSFLPRQLHHRGDRLVYSNGVIVLAVAAAALLIAFDGVTTRLVPLFAVGLFASFTLSQAGMVVHHVRKRERGWTWRLVINGVGAVATLAVLLTVVISKFVEGAWIPTVVIPAIIGMFLAINRHYRRFGAAVALEPGPGIPDLQHTVVVLVGRLNRGLPPALAFAKSLHPRHLVAMSVAEPDSDVDEIVRQWNEHKFGINLEVVESEYRDVTGPVLRYLDELDGRWSDDIIDVIIPEFVIQHWWQQVLHNQIPLAIKARLLRRPNTVVISVPFRLEE